MLLITFILAIILPPPHKRARTGTRHGITNAERRELR
jgi:hypothetical protein